jgi:uncharacterized membrane protein YidH (DUF202 family)
MTVARRVPRPARVLATGMLEMLAAIAAILTAAAGESPVILEVAWLGTATSFLVVGSVLVDRRPGNAVGPLVLLFGVAMAAFLILDGWVKVAGDRAGQDLAALLVSVLDGPIFLLVTLLFLVFPDGRLPSPRWRYLAWIATALAVIVFAGALMRPGPFPYYTWIENPIGVTENPLTGLYELAYGLLVGCVLIAACSLVVRWRRATAVERAQLKWVAAAALLTALAMITYGGTAGPTQYSDLGDLLVGVAFGLFPIAIGIAVLRYRLYEIDRIISRTIGWALVTGILGAVFVGAVILLQALMAGFTQGETLAVAASTLVAFALFQPLRRRVQSGVDQRFDRARYDGQRVIDAFAERLRDRVDLGEVETDIAATVREALRPGSVTVWVRTEAQG